MKKIILIILLVFLSACSVNENTNEIEEALSISGKIVLTKTLQEFSCPL